LSVPAEFLTVRDEDDPDEPLMLYLDEDEMETKDPPEADWNCHVMELTAGSAVTVHVIMMSLPVITLYVDCMFTLGASTKLLLICYYKDTTGNILVN
jgi:hypothetical protein